MSFWFGVLAGLWIGMAVGVMLMAFMANASEQER